MNQEYRHVGQCIYCKALPSSEDQLSDEHIFPLGLFGKQKLLRASCKRCAARTSAFEMKVLRDDLGHARIALDFPSRHNRPGNLRFPIEAVSDEGTAVTLELPAKSFIPPI